MTRPAYRVHRPVQRDSNVPLKVFGFVGLLAVIWLAGAWGLMLTIGMVHGWWPLVPTMPYSVALGLAAVKVAAAFAAGALSEVVKGAFK